MLIFSRALQPIRYLPIASGGCLRAFFIIALAKPDRINASPPIAIGVNRLLKHPILGRSEINLVDPVLDSGWQALSTSSAASHQEALGLGLGWSGPRMVWALDGLGLGNIDHLIAVIDFTLSKQKTESQSRTKSPRWKLVVA